MWTAAWGATRKVWRERADVARSSPVGFVRGVSAGIGVSGGQVRGDDGAVRHEEVVPEKAWRGGFRAMRWNGGPTGGRSVVGSIGSRMAGLAAASWLWPILPASPNRLLVLVMSD